MKAEDRSLQSLSNRETHWGSFRWTAAVIWLALVGAMTVWLILYSSSPGRSGTPPGQWPVQSSINRETGLPTLIMFVHPHCSCSRASIGELERLMALSAGRLSAHALFVQPPGADPDWVETDLWRSASAIPGVSVHRDIGGNEARRFQLETSGDVVLYGVRGQLQFHGGITLARGHAGDNPGGDAVFSLVRDPSLKGATTPVFGCSLFDDNGAREGGAK